VNERTANDELAEPELDEPDEPEEPPLDEAPAPDLAPADAPDDPDPEPLDEPPLLLVALVVPVPETLSPTSPDSETIVPLVGA